MKRKGFTIVELLVVVAILGVLIGIISTAAIGSIKNSRGKRAEAMRIALEQSIAAYYAQRDEWPKPIELKANSTDDQDTYTLTASEADQVFQEIVRNSVGASASRPLIDASALFVADSSKLGNSGNGCFDNHANRNKTTYCGDQRCINGVDFSVATKKGSKNKISLSQMAFGYQGSEYGKFRRFWILYNRRADSVKVKLSR